MRGTILCLGRLVVSTAVIVGAASHSFAQEVAPNGQYSEGLAVGGWKLFPKVFVGGVYDDNIHQTDIDRKSGGSLRVVPNIVGLYDGGIHKTSVYGVVDARFFDAESVSATAGFTHLYEAMRDLGFVFYGNYTRQTDLFNNALNFNNGALGPSISTSPSVYAPLVLNPFGTTPGVNPVAYNQFTGGTAVTKQFDKLFVTLGGTVYHIAFDHNNSPIGDPFRTSHDGTGLWVTGRVGYNVTPGLYVFGESSGIFQDFNNSLFNTNGYRVVGGVGSNDSRSFFRGEVFGGYQAQFQENHDVIAPFIPNDGVAAFIPRDVNTGVFGGRLYYYPTRYWTLMAQVDESLGISTTISPTIPEGTPTRVINAILQTNYSLSRWWSVGARAGYTRGDFIGISRVDEGWLAGASFNYEVWRNLTLTLDYQYTTVHSDAQLSDFTKNVVTAGLTYRY